MERVCLCLYGHIRTFNQCWHNLNQCLIDMYEPDIFMMTWVDSFGNFQHPTSSTNHKSHPGYDPNSQKVDNYTITAIMNSLRPQGIHLDNYHLHDNIFEQLVKDYSRFNHPSIHHRPKGTLGQVYGRCISLKLKQEYEKKHNFKYDRVVCTRYDIDYHHIIDLSLLDNTVISHDGMFGNSIISDAWTAGPSDLMDKWALQFDYIPILVKNNTMNFGPHEWLDAHSKELNIPYQSRPDIIQISIKR